MSYASSAALQAALFGRLSALPALAGVPVLDAVPHGSRPGTFVLIGPEEVRDQSDKSSAGAEHRVTISVISDAEGFLAAKSLAVAISDSLAGSVPVLARGRIVGVWFLRAVARRLSEGRVRRIDMTFRVRVEN